MFTGFQHSIAGGQGNLIATSLKSPNFVHGVQGWAINKNGSAEFHNIIIPSGSGGTVVTFASSAPGSPNVGDVWYNTSAGLEASVWNGTTWVPYQIGSGAIAAGTVVAGIVDATTINAATFIGSTFQGTELIINGTGTFWYRGTPGANSLRISAVGTTSPVQDPFGNWALPGLTIYAGSGPYTAYEYFANAIQNGSATVMTGVSSPWTMTIAIEFTLPGMIFAGGPISSLDGTPANPTVIITDNWHALTLAGTWSNNGADVLKATLMPDDSVWIRGRISNTASQVSGAAITTLGAGYFNTARNSFGTGSIANTNLAMPMDVNTAGSMTITGAYTAGQALIVDMRYPLNIT